MISAPKLINAIKEYNPDLNEALIQKAYIFAKNSHGSQKRHSGESYFSHPLAVAQILIDLKLDEKSIVAALLHDVAEDTDATLENIKELFGNKIAELVSGVTKLSSLETANVSNKAERNFRKLVIAISQDVRVLLIKLADRLHNMRTLSYVPSKEKRLKKAKETLEIYAPLAGRIGLEAIKNELQELAFEVVDFETRQYIINKIHNITKNQKDLIGNIIADLSIKLQAKNIDFELTGREKSPYSIFMKLKKSSIGFCNIYDIMAFRIIVNNIDECYKTLGTVSTNYNLIPNTFKDYISTPKENGYRSLHLSILGPYSKKIEIQIRDKEMHKVAEYGVAAHCSYKEDSYSSNYKLNNGRSKKSLWTNELLYILERAADLPEAIKNYKLDIYRDEVFCFTPNGDIFNLPVGSSAIDFAYAIHSDVGNKCQSVKINGVALPLRYKLENGDQVEIVTSDSAKPSPAWLQFAATSKAKTEIKQFIKNQKSKEYILLGESILRKFFSERGLSFDGNLTERVLQSLGNKSLAEIYCQIVEGAISRLDVLLAIYPDFKEKKNVESGLTPEFSAIDGVYVNMNITYCSYCNPILGDSIIGIVDIGTGVVIHHKNCSANKDFGVNQGSVINVYWKKNLDQSKYSFNSRINILIKNQTGILAEVSSIIAKENITINNIKIADRYTNHFKLALDLQVRDSDHLEEIILALRKSEKITEINREV